MSDVTDILGLGARGSRAQKAPVPGVSRRNNTGKSKIPRILYNLIGDQNNTTSLVSTAPTQKVRIRRGERNAAQRGRARSTEPISWRWKPFENSARKDDAQLSHWSSNHAPVAADYQFSRFNEKVKVVVPTPAEKESIPLLKDWAEEETNLLLSLCYAYELRWPVIHDRWSGKTPRTEEELKSRYFEIAKAILNSRFPSDGPSSNVETAILQTETSSVEVSQPRQGASAAAIMNLVWDGQKERERVMAAEKVLGKNDFDEQQLKHLRELSKKIDIEIRKWKRDGSLLVHSTSTALRAANDLRAPEHNLPKPTLGPAMGKGYNAYLRSSRLANISGGAYFGPRIVGKMTKVLTELNVPSRPVPTQRVCDAYDQLRQSVLTLLGAQKQLRKVNGKPRKIPPVKPVSPIKVDDISSQQPPMTSPGRQFALDELKAGTSSTLKATSAGQRLDSLEPPSYKRKSSLKLTLKAPKMHQASQPPAKRMKN